MYRLAMCLGAPAVQYPMANIQPPSLSQLQMVVQSIIQAVADAGRVLQLVILLLPLACWAPFAFSYGYKRRQWVRSFR